MKERGILFSGPMVKAIQSGAKTQTRRQVKFKPRIKGKLEVGASYLMSDGQTSKCPYGKVGDRLWVRETFGKIFKLYAYRADYHPGATPSLKEGDGKWKWTPSIFMPRAASRILLEITAVRAERLHDISEEDAKAEGVKSWWMPGYLNIKRLPRTYKGGFYRIWEDINKNWHDNPWVWVVTFKVIES